MTRYRVGDTGLILRPATRRERGLSGGQWCLERSDGEGFTPEQTKVLRAITEGTCREVLIPIKEEAVTA